MKRHAHLRDDDGLTGRRQVDAQHTKNHTNLIATVLKVIDDVNLVKRLNVAGLLVRMHRFAVFLWRT
ncbi:hypothetical protein [Bradyrhizobium lablabi]|uniref:hypothetical protein n=1 Tax=Bradyrhizobium lablabi TaxID=722472 RepID=UPI001BAAD72A|nr:hypothetical protein [Bradyrhizobium lablabi]MBR0692745.1 hypothetical protein [Bradyrhizobium lablabi]